MFVTRKVIVIILLISIQCWESNSLPIGAIQGKEEFIVKRASLWDRVRGKSITEDSPKQTYKYQKLGRVNSKADKHSLGGSIGSNHSEGQSSGSNSSEKSSMRKPTPSWLQPGNFPEHDSLPLKFQSEKSKLSSGGRKIENKANQFRGGVRQREFYRDGFTLVRGAKAARNALKQGAKLDKIDSKRKSSTFKKIANAIPRQITQMRYNKNLKTLTRVESDVNLHMREGRMKKNVLKDIAETAHKMNDIKIQIKDENKAKKASTVTSS